MQTNSAEHEISTSFSRMRSVRLNGRFLKGPISLSVLCEASRLPGQALALYLAIRHRRDLTGNDTVTVPAGLLQSFGIDKDAKSRALKQLSLLGLVTVQQHRGRSARITLTNQPVVPGD
jgi:DNA-binding MarR family transcriptional regulator